MQKLLWPLQRSDGCRLGDRTWAASTLPLNCPHCSYQGFRSRCVSNAPTRHSVGFRHTVDGEGAARQRWTNRRDRLKFSVVEKDMLVDIVGQNMDLRMFGDDHAKSL